MNLLVNDYLQLPFRNDVFDFVFDFGCFHHVGIGGRFTFIDGINRIIKPEGKYLLVCFSDKNSYAWNHFSENQIIELFRNHFRML